MAVRYLWRLGAAAPLPNTSCWRDLRRSRAYLRERGYWFEGRGGKPAPRRGRARIASPNVLPSRGIASARRGGRGRTNGGGACPEADVGESLQHTT